MAAGLSASRGNYTGEKQLRALTLRFFFGGGEKKYIAVALVVKRHGI